MGARFRLAKMSLPFKVGTVLVPGLAVLFAFVGASAPGSIRLSLLLAALIIVVACVGVWLFMRPSFFEVSDDALKISWPLRSWSIPKREISSVRLLSGAEFHQEFGHGVRIGAGGVWGKFGLYRTSKTTFSLWVSRFDELVVVELMND